MCFSPSRRSAREVLCAAWGNLPEMCQIDRRGLVAIFDRYEDLCCHHLAHPWHTTMRTGSKGQHALTRVHVSDPAARQEDQPAGLASQADSESGGRREPRREVQPVAMPAPVRHGLLIQNCPRCGDYR